MKKQVIALNNVSKAFLKPDRQELLVLGDVNLTLYEGEIVALLGKSGSGKSTLLRIISGLIQTTSGSVEYRGKKINKPVRGVNMVFQNFALMPWLTVLQNVELGLEAQGVPREIRRQRALKAIDTIGLDGFESAFPRELSGGMRQRVGLARALVVNPDVLLMDEPFSALDVLTAENLRSDLMELWNEDQTPLKSILMVTHDINEAAVMADKILIFNSDPGCIRAELVVNLPHPRVENSPKVRQLVDQIYSLMTSPERDLKHYAFGIYTHKDIDFGYRLPSVEVAALTGLLEEVNSLHMPTAIHLQDLAENLHFDVDDLFPIIDILDILRFAKVQDGDIELTDIGKAFSMADIQQKKEIFAKHLVQNVPLANYIKHTIDHNPSHRVNEEKFLTELEQHLTADEAKRVLTTVIEWGRYAELFAYNVNSRILSLDDPD